MIGTHPSRTADLIADGYVEVRTTDGYVWMAHPDRTCLRPLRSGLCELDKNHRGRCSTVVFYCDGCGHARRGQPAGRALDANGDVDVVFCFMCTRVASCA